MSSRYLFSELGGTGWEAPVVSGVRGFVRHKGKKGKLGLPCTPGPKDPQWHLPGSGRELCPLKPASSKLHPVLGHWNASATLSLSKPTLHFLPLWSPMLGLSGLHTSFSLRQLSSLIQVQPGGVFGPIWISLSDRSHHNTGTYFMED